MLVYNRKSSASRRKRDYRRRRSWFCFLIMKIINEVKKMWADTVKHGGKYSRKSLMMFVSFHVCITMWLLNQVFKMHVEEYMFFGFLGMAGGQAIISVWDKQTNKNEKTYNDNHISDNH